METFKCKFCDKECKNKNSLINHERLCKQNPNRSESPFVKFNQELSNGSRTIWNKGQTKETNDSVKKQGETLKRRYDNNEIINPNIGKCHTEDEKSIYLILESNIY